MNAAELRAWRKRLGWSQREAAEAMGWCLRHYHEMEQGKEPIRLVTELACAALALGLRRFPGPAE